MRYRHYGHTVRVSRVRKNTGPAAHHRLTGVDDDRDPHNLVDRLRRGEEKAFTGLVERFHTRLTRFALTFVDRRELAEDAAQETWAAVLDGIDRFEGRASLDTWLFQICANRARSIAERERRVVPVDPTGPTVDPGLFNASGGWASPVPVWADGVEERLDAAVLADRIRREVEELPEPLRQVVTLRDVDGFTAAQVCEILAISPANQRVRLHRGRARIRELLQREVTRP